MIALILALALQEGDFKAGAAAVDATPEKFPVIVNGMFTGRTAKGTVDPIRVRCLVLEDGTTRVAIAVVDSCMVPRHSLDRAKEAASKAAGIPVERMLVSATHTHSAPSAMGCLGSEADPDYPPFLEKKITEAIEKAAARLEPAEVGWAVASAPEHTYCRRWILRPDKVKNDPFGVKNVRAMMHPGYQSPDYIGPAGPVDADLSLLAVRSRDGKPLALVANYSMHYFGSGLVSADYYGAFCRLFAKATGADASFVPMMSQGTSGDQMWMDYGSPQKKIALEAYAEGVTTIAHEAWKTIAYRARGSIAMREAKLALGRRLCDGKRLEWARKIVAGLGAKSPQSQQEIYAREQVLLHEDPKAELRLQALRVAELGITAIPNEVVGLTGLRLKAMSPLQPTFNVELANGAEGYIPPPEQHKLGGYITWAARTAGLEVEAEPKIVETLLKLLEEVSGKPRRTFAEAESAYAKAVLASKPSAYWRLGEFTGTAAADSVGKATATFEDGIALHLEGPPLAGSQGTNRAPHLAGGRVRAEVAGASVELWFWNGLPNAARPVTGYLVSRGIPGAEGAAGDHLGIGGTDKPELAGRLFFFTGNARNEHLGGKTEIAPKTWHQVVLVRDGRDVRVYLDGALEIEGKTEALASDAATLFLGGRNDGFASFEGRIDEAAVYPRALTAEEAAAHFRAAGP